MKYCKSCGIISSLIVLFIEIVTVKSQIVSEKIPLGAIFEQGTDEVQSAFKFAMLNHNVNMTKRRFELQAYVDVINTADAFKLSRLICNQFSRGVFSMLGAVSPESFDTLHSYSNTFQMPFVTPWFPEKLLTPRSGFFDFALSMRPDYHTAIIDTIRYYGWKKVVYLYDSHDGLLRLQQIYQGLKPGDESFRVETVKRITNVTNAVQFLRTFEALDRWSRKYIILDCSVEMAKQIIIHHVRDISLGRRTYHYLLSGLVMDDQWESNVIEFGAINITGFKIIDERRMYVQEFLRGWKNLDPSTSIDAGKDSISAQAALMYDAVYVLVEAFNKLLRKNPDQFRSYTSRRMNSSISMTSNVSNSGTNISNVNRVLDCNTSKGWVNAWEHGDKISRYLKKVEIEGLTGFIKFDDDGRRKDYTLSVVEMTSTSNMHKVAEWSKELGLKPTKHNMSDDQIRINADYERNRTYIITSFLEEPFLMQRKGRLNNTTDTNDLYEGYCKDLAELISKKLGINYAFRVVKENSLISEGNEASDRIVGELIRKQADIAIAPLAINSELERLIDLSMPFLHFGISIMIKKPPRQNEGMFSFMNPLSKEIWVCIVFSCIGVSIVLCIVSRFSKSEWNLTHKNDADIMTSKDFGLWSSFWFVFGSFMQQTNYLSPTSMSVRIVSAVWWFFTFIMVSTYIANFAALLTLERMTTPICSIDELIAQRSVRFGTLVNSSMLDFFRKSTIPTYAKIYDYMEKHPEMMVRSHEEGIHRVRSSNGNYAFLIESPKNDYISEREPCDTMKIGENLDSHGFGIGTPLGSPLSVPISFTILSLMESGELTKLQNKWWNKHAKCDNTMSPYNAYSDDGLALNNLAGIFFILICGLIISLFVATMEFCFKHHDSMKKHQKFETKSIATTSTLNVQPVDHKLKVQEPKDFDNGRMTYYQLPKQGTHHDPDDKNWQTITLPHPVAQSQDPHVQPTCANTTIRRAMTHSHHEMENVLNET